MKIARVGLLISSLLRHGATMFVLVSLVLPDGDAPRLEAGLLTGAAAATFVTNLAWLFRVIVFEFPNKRAYDWIDGHVVQITAGVLLGCIFMENVLIVSSKILALDALS